jgi:hypothetical protein
MLGRKSFLPMPVLFLGLAMQGFGQGETSMWGRDESSFDEGQYKVHVRQVLNSNVREYKMEFRYNREFQLYSSDGSGVLEVRFSTPSFFAEMTEQEGEKTVTFFPPKGVTQAGDATSGGDVGCNILFARISRGFGVSDQISLEPGVKKVEAKKVSYTLTWNKEFLFPIQIQSQFRERALCQWAFDDPLKVRPGVYIPRRATQIAPVDSHTHIKKVFTIQDADFSQAPANEICTYDWYRPGHRLIDERVDPPVSFTYEDLVKLSGKQKGLRGDELLSFSRLESAKIKKESMKAINRYETQQVMKRSRIWVSVLTGIATFFIVAIGLFGYQRLKSPGPL